MLSDSKRIKEIMDYYNLVKVVDFAVFIHRRPDAIYKTLNQGEPMTKALKDDIVHYCSDFNPEWIRSGKGEKFRSKEDISRAKPGSRDPETELKRLSNENEELKRKVAFLEGQLHQQEKQYDSLMSLHNDLVKKSGRT